MKKLFSILLSVTLAFSIFSTGTLADTPQSAEEIYSQANRREVSPYLMLFFVSPKDGDGNSHYWSDRWMADAIRADYEKETGKDIRLLYLPLTESHYPPDIEEMWYAEIEFNFLIIDMENARVWKYNIDGNKTMSFISDIQKENEQ